MSDTAPDGTRTLHAVPAPEPLTQLSGAPVTVYTELTNLTGDDGATVAELALAAGLGRSTTGKALTTLEEHGLAARTPGGHEGARRTPDRWRAAPTPGTSNGDGQSTPESAPAQLDHPAANSLESAADGADTEDAAADEPGPDTPTALDNGRADDVPGPLADEVQDAPAKDAEQSQGDSDEDDPHDEVDHDGPEDKDAADPQTGAKRPAPAAAAIILPGEKKRLAPGALRQMVIAHLQAHPGEAFTATRISRVIEKSSGAIANALVTLARQGIAEQLDDRPRTYRLATPEGNG
ncbi:helix-turn-helix domain-containing protein [Streptomyces mirabilis]|uniref:helix-turn-helix domain-containing protein n=1 Tax=Streptomyces mirabilis TaxID=68239 RepID=UPI0033A3A279